MRMLDIILFVFMVLVFFAGVYVGGVYGGYRGLKTEIKLWIKERVK